MLESTPSVTTQKNANEILSKFKFSCLIIGAGSKFTLGYILQQRIYFYILHPD